MLRRWPLAAVAVLLVTVVPCGGATRKSRPAVELYNPRPLYPLAAKGSGIDPEVTVRVRVDRRGKVSKVEIVRIEPSSHLDPVFEQEIGATLSRWRYAPRYENGQPVETELVWVTPFISGLQRGRLSGWAWWESLLGSGKRDGPSLLSLPLEQRRHVLEEQVRAGIGALGPGATYRASSGRFVVRTDASQETADTIARNLEAIYNLLDSMFAATIPPQRETLKVQVFAYSTPAKLAQLASAGPLMERSPPGFYSASGLIALHLQLATPADALGHLLHEATHAYVDRHLVRPGVRLPVWLQEGLAEYISNSEVKRGRLVPGEARQAQRNYVRMVQGSVVVTRAAPRARLSLQEIRTAAKQGRALTLGEMLDADPEEFYGERLRLYYSTAWMLVHFLRHGRPDWEADRFALLLLYLVEGYRASEVFEAVYRQPIEELEPAFRRYLETF